MLGAIGRAGEKPVPPINLVGDFGGGAMMLAFGAGLLALIAFGGGFGLWKTGSPVPKGLGLGLMIGFRLIKNFDMPYTSRSITEFWRRWHISLSTWLRDYVFFSFVGRRARPGAL